MEKFSLERIYSRLGDEESRFLFEKRLCYGLTNDLPRMVRAINGIRKNTVYEKLQETKKEIFLFGAGVRSRLAVNAYPEIHWRAFIDNDNSKIGKHDILPVISFQEFMQNSRNAVVFIDSMYIDGMKQQLINSGFPEDSIIQYFGNVQYFDLPYFKPQKDEFFIDAGGLNGYSTKCFFEWLQNNTERCQSIIFEPDSNSYKVCKDNIQKWNYNNVEVVNKGLWHKKETLRFCRLGGASSINLDGEEIIETVSLDEYIGTEKEPVTFIKMDIEGAELNALKGAEKTIIKHKPKLAICIYHKPEDVWEIPNLLLDFVPDYKFYIRHYSFNDTETVLYAFIEKRI
jgi:FkbM family methyltransferase